MSQPQPAALALLLVTTAAAAAAVNNLPTTRPGPACLRAHRQRLDCTWCLAAPAPAQALPSWRNAGGLDDSGFPGSRHWAAEPCALRQWGTHWPLLSRYEGIEYVLSAQVVNVVRDQPREIIGKTQLHAMYLQDICCDRQHHTHRKIQLLFKLPLFALCKMQGSLLAYRSCSWAASVILLPQ